jgi:hypothetical protein
MEHPGQHLPLQPYFGVNLHCFSGNIKTDKTLLFWKDTIENPLPFGAQPRLQAHQLVSLPHGLETDIEAELLE